MTSLCYYKDAYLKFCKSTLKKIEGNSLLLSDTIFFPKTSTEPCDIGMIETMKVIAVEKSSGDIWHTVDQVHTMLADSEVALKLDWDRRYKIMKLHSALHLVAGIFESKYEIKAVAGIVNCSSAHLVFKHKLDEKVMINDVCNQVNLDIKSNIAIKSYYDPNRSGFRWCQIGEYSPIPCGGVHLKNTGEINSVAIRSENTPAEKCKLNIEVH